MAEQFATDGSNTFLGGQDASKIPSLVPQDSYYAGVNISVSKGVPTPPWGFDKKTLKFPDEDFDVGNNVLIPYKTIFHSCRYQACIPYSIGPDSYLLIVVAGIMFLVNIDSYVVRILSLPDGDTINENQTRVNWSNAGKYLVIFDAPNFPIILDGITARRSDPTKFEVPVSVLGAYNQNRLFVSNLGEEFTAGDPTGSLAAPEAPITFLEVEQLAAPFFGQIFELPTDTLKDQITAMAFLQFTDTSTGIGPLLVATSDAICSYNSQNPRTSWETGNFGTCLVFDAGIAGPRAFINVNSDLFFLSADGQVRTLSMSRQEQGKWSHVPISREVENWLIYNDPSLVSYGVLGSFQNRIFVTANPYRVDCLSRNRTPIFDVAFGGFVIIELDNLATLGKDGQPAWSGLRTSVRPMDIVNCNQRSFVMSKDDESSNELYEVNPNTSYDTSDGLVRPVTSIVYSREYDFQSPFQNKDIHSMDLELRNVQGDFSVDVQYKPSQGSRFVDWFPFSHKAPWRQCGNPSKFFPNGLVGHSFKDLTIGSPIIDECAEVSQQKYSAFRKLQLKLTLEGIYWELQQFRLKAKPQPQSEQINVSCVEEAVIPVPAQCNNDWAIKPFKSCSSLQT